MSESIEHIGLPPKKSKVAIEEDVGDLVDDARLWTPFSDGGYVGAIDRGDGWESAVTVERLSMEEDSYPYDEYVQIGED